MNLPQMAAPTGYLLELNGRLADVCTTAQGLNDAIRVLGDRPDLTAFWLDRAGQRHSIDLRRFVASAYDTSGNSSHRVV